MESVKLLRYINITAMVAVAFFNLLDCIDQKVGAWEYFAFCAPFVVGAVLLMIFRGYKVNAVFYALAGIVIALTGSMGNFSGAIYLVFSIYIFNSTITSCLLIIGYSVAIAARYLLKGHTIPDVANMFAAYAFTIGIYFVLIHPKPQAKPVIARVDDITIDIVRYLRDGKRPKEIAPLVYMEPGAVYQRLSRTRKQFGCGSDPELCKIFDDAGYFGVKVDK